MTDYHGAEDEVEGGGPQVLGGFGQKTIEGEGALVGWDPSTCGRGCAVQHWNAERLPSTNHQTIGVGF